MQNPLLVQGKFCMVKLVALLLPSLTDRAPKYTKTGNRMHAVQLQ
jgi:hypothetical protein